VGELYAHDGSFLGVGTYSPVSRIAFRVFTHERRPLDEAYFKETLERTAFLREGIPSDAYRVLYSESDQTPGFIVDRYADGLVLQVRTLGAEKLKPELLKALVERFRPAFVYERSDFVGRKDEGLEPFKGLLWGELKNPVLIREHEFTFLVDVERGLKTGFYLDQRENRLYASSLVKEGSRVLDLFCYTGGFSVYCAKRGARVTGVDLNERALELARENARINGVEVEFVKANAFEYLEQDRSSYDLIIADPPAIAKARKEKESLKWAVWKLAYHAFPRLRRGGRLFICVCSYQLSADELARQVRLAATDRGRKVVLKELRLQPYDHPYLPTFPESLYLKCGDFILV